MTPTTERSRVLDFPAIYYYTPVCIRRAQRCSRGKGGGPERQDHRRRSRHHVGGLYQSPAQDRRRRCAGVHLRRHARRGEDVWRQPGPSGRFAYGQRGPTERHPVCALPTVVAAVKNGYPIVRVEGKPAYYEPLAIAVDKGDEAFDSELSKAIAQMKADGTLSNFREVVRRRSHPGAINPGAINSRAINPIIAGARSRRGALYDCAAKKDKGLHVHVQQQLLHRHDERHD